MRNPPQKRRGNEPRKSGEAISGKVEPQVEQITNLVLQRVEQRIEQHLHLPIRMPDNAELVEMREKTPEAYGAFLRMTEERSSADAHVDRAAFDYPFSLARRGQVFGIAALILVLVFCAYLASLGETGQVIGGIIAAIDLVAIIGTLMGSNTGRDPR